MNKKHVLTAALLLIFNLLFLPIAHSEIKETTNKNTVKPEEVQTPSLKGKATKDIPAKTLDNSPDRKTLSPKRKTLSSRKTISMKKPGSAKPVLQISPSEQQKYRYEINKLLEKNKLDKAVAVVKKDPFKLYTVMDKNTDFGVHFVTKITKDPEQTKAIANLFFSQDVDYFNKLFTSEESLIHILVKTAKTQPKAFQTFMVHACRASWFSCAVRLNEVAKTCPSCAVSSFTAAAPRLGKKKSVNLLLTLDENVRRALVEKLSSSPSYSSQWKELLTDSRLSKDIAQAETVSHGMFSSLYKKFRRTAGKFVRAAFQTFMGKGPFVEKYAEQKILRNGIRYKNVYGVRNLRISYPVQVQIFDFDMTKFSLSPFYNKNDEKQLGKNNVVAVFSGTYWDNDLLPMGTYMYGGKLLSGTQSHLDYNLVSKLYGEAGFVLWNNEKTEILNLKKIASQKSALNFKQMNGFVQGGPLIVENNRVATRWIVPGEAYNGADTYAAIGLTKAHHLLFAMTKTFTNEETGVTYKELAELLIKEGAHTAMCVDGGGLEGIAILHAKMKTQIPLTKNVFLIHEKKTATLAYNK